MVIFMVLFNAKLKDFEYDGYIIVDTFVGPGVFYKPERFYMIDIGKKMKFSR